MRKSLFVFTAIVIALSTAFSCSNDKKPTSYLEASYTGGDVPSNGGSASISVKSNVDYWSVSTTAAWVTIAQSTGSGSASVALTFEENTSADNRSATITVKSEGLPDATATVVQLSLSLPGAAGEITGTSPSDATEELTIGEISGAKTYKWYKDGAEVQNTASRNYTAVASGTYKVAGVNERGEGTPSPDYVVTLTPGTSATFNDYLGDYSFTADFTLNVDDGVVETRTYSDTMIDASLYGGDPGEMYFTNGFNAQNNEEFGHPIFIDFAYSAGPSVAFALHDFDYFQDGRYVFRFIPGVISGTDIYFVLNFDVELDMTTGQIVFPKTLTRTDSDITGEAYYSVFVWDAATGDAKGRYTDFMSNIVATKVASTSGVAPSAGSNIVKIPVHVTLPAGIDANIPVSTKKVMRK